MEYQKEMGHFAIDSGADMVIGHHSHQPQPIEVYQGKPILCSLANFVHDLAGFPRADADGHPGALPHQRR